jgi:polyhydroxyalkanoate synthesis regulator phasin
LDSGISFLSSHRLVLFLYYFIKNDQSSSPGSQHACRFPCFSPEKIYGVTPKGIERKISNVMEGANSKYDEHEQRDLKELAKESVEYGGLTPALAIKRVQKLEQQMYEHARNLEFEEAGRLRDAIEKLKAIAFGTASAEAD